MKPLFSLRIAFSVLAMLAVSTVFDPVAVCGQDTTAAPQKPPQKMALPPAEQAAPPGGPAQPVYIYLYSRFTDHVNLELEEARLRQLLPMLEKYRQRHPEAHVCATILFSGAISRSLAERDASGGTVAYVKGFVRRGVIQVGYDGMDEPTYQKRPLVDLSTAKSPEERWLIHAAAAKDLLVQGHDPLTGELQPGVSGGLKEAQAVFGKAVAVNAALSVPSPFGPKATRVVTRAVNLETSPPSARGGPEMSMVPEVGDDREVAEQVVWQSSQAIMFGLPDANPAQLAGFWGAETGFSRLISPAPDTSPELYWQNNVLRSSEGSDEMVRLIPASAGPEGIQRVLSGIARSKVRIIHVELGSEEDYVQPWWVKQGHTPLRYAYDHPEQPRIPPNAVRDRARVEAAQARQEAVLRLLAENFFPANPGSRFVSSTDLKSMTPSNDGFSVSVENLRSALSALLEKWGNDTFPPPFLFADGHYLSLANLFQVMTDAWTEFNRTGSLPSSVPVIPVNGPLVTLMGHGPNAGEVTVADIAASCPAISQRLHDQTESPVPKNSIPSGITAGGIDMNAAQFLRLMATAIVTPDRQARFRVKMTYLSPGTAMLTPKTRALVDMGGAWTIKPAPIVASAPEQGAGGKAR
ncbi:MAG TPA: hypothetical protein VGZ29_03475 [Terriglobia bacterium]|nr:hypothetical protein [Terriglobia bacterium]